MREGGRLLGKYDSSSSSFSVFVTILATPFLSAPSV